MRTGVPTKFEAYRDKQNKEAKKRYIGMSGTNKQGLSMKVVDYQNSKNATVEFDDGIRRYGIPISSFLRGYVPYPKEPENASTLDSSAYHIPVYAPDKEVPKTDKKKIRAKMSNDEKRSYYDAEIARLKEKIKKTERKRDHIGNISEKSWAYVCCSIAGTLIDRDFVADTWYQNMGAKEREKAIREYASSLKEAAEKGGFNFNQ